MGMTVDDPPVGGRRNYVVEKIASDDSSRRSGRRMRYMSYDERLFLRANFRPLCSACACVLACDERLAVVCCLVRRTIQSDESRWRRLRLPSTRGSGSTRTTSTCRVLTVVVARSLRASSITRYMPPSPPRDIYDWLHACAIQSAWCREVSAGRVCGWHSRWAMTHGAWFSFFCVDGSSQSVSQSARRILDIVSLKVLWCQQFTVRCTLNPLSTSLRWLKCSPIQKNISNAFMSSSQVFYLCACIQYINGKVTR